MNNKNLKSIIKNSNKILLLTHINPDGDALGSVSACYTTIYQNFKKKPDIVIVGHFPNSLKYLPNIEKAKTEFDDSMVYDLVIALDVAAPDRFGNAQILFEKSKYKINIDHHKTNIGFGDINIVTPNASSTGEVLLGIFESEELKISLDSAIGLYTAILTDTGGFRYENTSKKVFESAAKLVEIGVNPNTIYRNCYESKSKDFIMFQNYCMNKAEFLYDNKVAYTTVYKRDYEKFNGDEEFSDGLVENLRAIESTDIAFIAKEIDSKTTKFSLRSKKTDVAEISAVFGGGGHTFAAGCSIKANVEGAVKRLLKVIEEKING